jgi:hypothetical protein
MCVHRHGVLQEWSRSELHAIGQGEIRLSHPVSVSARIHKGPPSRCPETVGDICSSSTTSSSTSDSCTSENGGRAA